MPANFAAPAPVNFGRARREKLDFVRHAVANLMQLEIKRRTKRQALAVRSFPYHYSHSPRAVEVRVGV
jgi:hypothetical protein